MDASLFNSQEFSDVQVHLIQLEGDKEKTIYAHKAILANNSPFFRTLFQTNFKEKDAKIVDIKVEDVDIALKLVEFLYAKGPFVPENTEELAVSWLIIKPEKENKLPYPGIRGTFNLEVEKQESGVTLRELHYISETLNSVIKSFELWKYSDKKIRITYKFSSKSPNLREYLKQNNIFLEKIDWKLGEDVTDLNEKEKTELLVKLILENNYFPPTEVRRINELFDNKL